MKLDIDYGGPHKLTNVMCHGLVTYKYSTNYRAVNGDKFMSVCKQCMIETEGAICESCVKLNKLLDWAIKSAAERLESCSDTSIQYFAGKIIAYRELKDSLGAQN